jgi:hypothetical protein
MLSSIGHDGEKKPFIVWPAMSDPHLQVPMRHTHDTAEHEVPRNLRKAEREKGCETSICGAHKLSSLCNPADFPKSLLATTR